MLKQHITTFLKNLLGTTTDRDISLQPDLWDIEDRLSMEQCLGLEQFFTIEEIKSVVFSCNPSKAPGPDGFSFLFFQAFWDILNSYIYKFFSAFYFHDLDISKLN